MHSISGGIIIKVKTSITPLGREIVLIKPWFGKRVFDFLISLLALLFLGVPILAVSLLVKLTSPGPVFYRDKRLGWGGRCYAMLKFRSMKYNAQPLLNKNGKLIVGEADPRLTPIGRLLRILHLDETPQLVNVIRGDMSFVGPRSGQPQYEHTYSSNAYERLRVRPGITGLAAIVGGRHLENECLYAVEAAYVRHQSLLLDFLIVILTPVYVLMGSQLTRRILARYLDNLHFAELDAKNEN